MKNFKDGIPIELEEAAWVDGALIIISIFKIIVPPMFPGICVVFIFTFSSSWGNFFVPYILLQTVSKLPASVILYQFFWTTQHGSIWTISSIFSIICDTINSIIYISSKLYV